MSINNINKSAAVLHNYSVGEVLEKYDSGVRTEEIVYLKEYIEEYRTNAEKSISDILQRIPAGDKAEVMKWIEMNTEDALKPYVRMAYLGKLKDGDVLKRNPGRYKTVADLGIPIEEPDRSSKVEELMEYWKIQGEQVKSFIGKDQCNQYNNYNMKHTESYQNKSTGIFETHAHYYLEQYKGCCDELLELMQKSGVDHIVIPAIEYSSNFKMKEMFEDMVDSGFVHMAYGTCHPKYLWKEIEQWDEGRWAEFRSLIRENKPVAIGETGLDYSYSEFNEEHRKFQRDFFIRSIEEANSAELPVILHIRPSDFVYGCLYDADRDAAEILREHPVINGAVAHCFGGNPDTMRLFMDAGVRYFGIGGRITYGEEGLIESVRTMPLESLLLETDSPFIRVNRDSVPNTSLSIYYIAAKVAEIRGCSTGEILKASNDNAFRFFNILS